MDRLDPKVFLIGGAPRAGKTTLASALSVRLGLRSLSIDDLLTAAQAVTTPESHPGLHAMRRVPSIEYFTNSPVDQLKADATLQHEAIWPPVEQVIRRYVRWGPGIVIEGWHLRPDRVAGLELENVQSAWIVAPAGILEERERANVAWFSESSDPARMLRNFLARSRWYNELIGQQATELEMKVLTLESEPTVENLCELVLERPE